ncbi:MAG: RND transporter [Flavobacteriales bacterium]|mgnify:CR=1 FL=1|nr:RND transporter [Flavobacteriales bacterium]|tara:strand:- start:375 stop:3476 length:3102 start_codon:yes stop_codon:yes gene_type:complete
MKNIISYFIKYPITANLLMFLIFAFGIVGLNSLRSTFFPEMTSRLISIQAVSAGLSPIEIEESITKKIEYKLESVSGVKDINSSSVENISTIYVEMERGANMYVGLQNINNAVDQVNFGVDIDELFIRKREFVMPTISFSISSDYDLSYLKEETDRIEDELKSVDGISEISITGLPEKEIEIAISEDKLLGYNLSIEDINRAILSKNINLTGGKIEVNDTQYLLRSNNKFNSSDEIKNIIIRVNENGSPLYLKEVAQVYDSWSEASIERYRNNKRSINIVVSNTETQDIIFIANYIKEYVKELNKTNQNINAKILFDASNPLKQRIELLSKNGIIGFFLVLLFLTMFLHPRVSFWVALSIPISFLGMFFLAPSAPITINMMTMYAMILVIGILVDDGIIIGENIIRKFEGGLNRYQAAVEGTMEVFPAVFAGVSTTAVAFLSFFFFEGMMGEFGWQMGFVVIATLAFSLVEGAFILPAHIAYSKALDKNQKKNKISNYFNKVINNIRDNYYKPLLRYFMKNTRIAYLFFIGIFVLFVFGSGVSFTFFPSVELDDLYVQFKTKPGTTMDKTKMYADDILHVINRVNKEMEDSLSTSIINATEIKIGPGSHKGTIDMFLAPPEQRGVKAYDIVEKIRSEIGDMEGIENLIMGVGDPFGKPLAFALLSNNTQDLEAASELFMQELKEIKGVAAASSDYEYGPNEINFTLKEKAKGLGLNNYEIVYQVRQAFFGTQVQDLQSNKDEMKLWIRYDENKKNSFSSLENMKIKTSKGTFPLKELVHFDVDNKIISINRKNGSKIIEIEGELASASSYSSDIISEVENNMFPLIQSKFPSVKLELSGSSDEGTVTANSMKKIMPVFTLLILCIVLITFRSKAQTLVVFVLMPFTLVGVFFGHLLHGLPISVLSGFGVVALIGVLVNDALVFITAFNLRMRNGEKFLSALEETAITRFRPIMLTTITTVFGLLPLIFEKSMQAQFLIPMAISLSYGIIMATLLTLLLLPVILLTINNIRLYVSQTDNREAVEPAVKEIQNKL